MYNIYFSMLPYCVQHRFDYNTTNLHPFMVFFQMTDVEIEIDHVCFTRHPLLFKYNIK